MIATTDNQPKFMTGWVKKGRFSAFPLPDKYHGVTSVANIAKGALRKFASVDRGVQDRGQKKGCAAVKE